MFSSFISLTHISAWAHILIVCSLFLSNKPVTAQSAEPVSPSDAVKQSYTQQVGPQALIFRGTEYIGYDRRIKGHQFFLDDDWQSGEIMFDGHLYQNVAMRFDITGSGAVVVAQQSIAYDFRLPSGKIDYFKTMGRTFRYIAADSAKQAGIESGFYDIRHDGQHASFFVLHKKSPERSTADREVYRWFSENQKFYLYKNGEYIRISKKGSLLRALPKESKKELQRFVRTQGLRFGSTPENGLLEVIRYYDQSATR